MRDKLIRSLEVKTNTIECLCNNILEEIARLKDIKESIAKEQIEKTDDTYVEAVKLVAYIEALEDVAEAVNMCGDDYCEVLYDNCEEDLRALELDTDEMYEEDYTCYPLPDEDCIDENISAETIPF